MNTSAKTLILRPAFWKNWQLWFFLFSLVVAGTLMLVRRHQFQSDCANPQPKKLFKHCDYTGFDFSGRDLRNVVFEGLSFAGAKFDNAILLNTSFKGSNLNHTSFHGARILFTNFSDTCLVEADFTGAQFHPVNFWDGAYMQEANFSKTLLESKAESLQTPSHRIDCK